MIVKFSNLKELLTFNIKYYRYLNGFSQEKLAELCNLSPRYLTDVERGLHCPTVQKLEILANAFNIEPYELFMNPKREKNIIEKMSNTRQYNQSTN